jgi:peptidoglycan hydrolase CwlO-like protein
MAIVVRIVSGILEGREFKFEADKLRMGDGPDVDVQLEDGGARGRVVEIEREGTGFHIRSMGDRDLSAQSGQPLDRVVEPGDQVRFGAWGPIFILNNLNIRTAQALDQRTAPISSVATPGPIPALPTVPITAAPVEPKTQAVAAPGLEDSASKKRKSVLDATAGLGADRPLGIKTVSMMIQDALGKAKESEAGVMEKSTMFIRELVTDTMKSGTRNLKLGLMLLGAAFSILLVALVYNIIATRSSIDEVSRTAAQKVEAARTETAGQLKTIQAEKDQLAKDTEAVSKKIGDLEKDHSASQAEILALRNRLKDTDTQRKSLEDKLTKVLVAVEKDREATSKKLEKMEKERAEEKARMEAEERRRREEQAARDAAEREKAAAAAATPAPAPVQPR